MGSRVLSGLLALVLLSLVVVGCSATGDLEVEQASEVETTVAPQPEEPDSPATQPAVESTTQEVPETAAGAPTLGAPARDRIVVATGDGRVYLIDPDGGRQLDLTPAGVAGHPVWSPDGRRIAWSQRDAVGFSVTTANVDGTEQRRAATPFAGYFGYWNPPSSRLGYLGNAPPGTGLVVDDGTGADLDSIVDSDTFYYFSWSPDGTRWVVHSGSGFRIVTLDGTSTPIDLQDATFRAPTWAGDGSILLAARITGRNMIVRLDPDTGEFEELIEVGDLANFVLDPTGRYLAIESVVFGAGDDDPGEGITAAVSQQPGEPGAVVLVYDMRTGDVREVVAERTGGFWWSPDGSTLALLVREERPNPMFVQWLVWRGGESFRTERFIVSPMFANAYLPFFDQFAQSVTPWSPDSSRFVYSAFDALGEPGVFVQPARPDAAAQRISGDVGVAFWSPT